MHCIARPGNFMQGAARQQGRGQQQHEQQEARHDCVTRCYGHLRACQGLPRRQHMRHGGERGATAWAPHLYVYAPVVVLEVDGSASVVVPQSHYRLHRGGRGVGWGAGAAGAHRLHTQTLASMPCLESVYVQRAGRACRQLVACPPPQNHAPPFRTRTSRVMDGDQPHMLMRYVMLRKRNGVPL